jgi:hypothetical protein
VSGSTGSLGQVKDGILPEVAGRIDLGRVSQHFPHDDIPSFCLSIVLPQVIDERSVQPFKFWFNHHLQDGLHCQKDLFYRLRTVQAAERAQLYKAACRLSRHGAMVVVTVAADHCSLWISLRNQKVAALAIAEQTGLNPAADIPLGEADTQPLFP